jgi:two-component system response regulator protein BraR/BceR
MYTVFLVEDDRGIAEAIRTQAQQWGLLVHIAADFRNVLQEFLTVKPQLVLLDISLPFYDGFHWCQEIRRVSKVPILFISSASDNMNMIMAMNMGADDFVAKPFDGRVLMAKIQALLRRTYDFAGDVPLLEHRGAILNTGDHTLTVGDTVLEMTKNEYRILLCLMENKGKVVSREELMQRLWETDSFVDENTLTVNINRLRKKLSGVELHDFITTKFGEGYTL